MIRSRKIGFVASLALVAVVAASLLAGAGSVSASCGNVGVCWVQVTSVNVGTGDNYLKGVSVVSHNSIWAAGYYLDANGSNAHTLIELAKGTTSGGHDTFTWSQVSSTNPGTGNYLNGIVVKPASITQDSSVPVWAVGYYTSTTSADKTLVEYWNGTSWSTSTSPNSGSGDNQLNGVSADPYTNTWAVGSHVENGINEPLVMSSTNGTSWSLVSTPSTISGTLTSVSIVDASHVWAAGYFTDTTTTTSYAITMFWDGSTWTSYIPPYNSNERYDTISFLDRNDGKAGGWNPVGYAGTYEDAWDSGHSQWVSDGGIGSKYHAMQYNASASAWAVGELLHFDAPFTTFAAHWDGSSWGDTHSVDPTSDCSLWAVSAVATNDVWVVGYYRDATSNKQRTLIEHYASS